MKELVRHLERLLLNHDCVAIPQIGGFVTSNKPARYVEEENLYLPPFRSVGFNERLKTDDKLLVQSYEETYKCSQAEAKRMIGEEITNLQKELWDTGSYDLGSIGVLSLDDSGNIQFSPCLAGTVCPSYYGLDALWMQPLQEEAVSTTDTISSSNKTTRAIDMQENEEITIHLKKTWLYNTAAVVAIALITFFISPEAKNTDQNHNVTTQFTRLLWLPENQNVSTLHITPIIPQPIKTQKAKQSKPEIIQKEAKEPTMAQPQIYTEVEKGYCVVAASALGENNARKYVERLHQEGYTDAQIYKNGDMIRVVFPGYQTEEEARMKKKELNTLSQNAFASAWIYEIK